MSKSELDFRGLLSSIQHALNMIPDQKDVGMYGESSYDLASALDKALKAYDKAHEPKKAEQKPVPKDVVLTAQDQQHLKDLRMGAMILYDKLGTDIEQMDNIIRMYDEERGNGKLSTEEWIVKSRVLEVNLLKRSREQLQKDIISGNYDY